jgi:hypothetical protein
MRDPCTVRALTRSPTRLAALLAAAACAWLALVALTPVLRRSDIVAVRLAGGLFHGACSRLCHQRPERSFATAGLTWPVCGRCTGLYLGAALGALAAWAAVRRAPSGAFYSGRTGPNRARVLLVGAAAPTAISWGLEAVGLTAVPTAVRFVAAVPLGAAAAWVVALAAAAAVRPAGAAIE